MANAGRVKHHLFNNIEDPKNTILIVGYCTPQTPGGVIRSGATEVKLFGEMKQIRARVEIMDSFSAHGDRHEMLDFIKNQVPELKQLFLVHGEKEVQDHFKVFLTEAGFNNISIPHLSEIVEI
jgi:metallo-beta-lactamase family protein